MHMKPKNSTHSNCYLIARLSATHHFGIFLSLVTNIYNYIPVYILQYTFATLPSTLERK